MRTETLKLMNGVRREQMIAEGVKMPSNKVYKDKSKYNRKPKHKKIDW